MCDVKSGEEVTLDLPSSLFRRKNGFSMDYGGSGIKMVYSTDEGDKVRFHFIIYPRGRQEEAFDDLRHRLPDMEPSDTMYITGYGCAQNLDTIQQHMHRNVELTWELGHIVQSVQFLLENCDAEEMFYTTCEEAKRAALSQREKRNRILKLATNAEESATEKEEGFPCFPKKDDVFPFMLVLLGSVGGSFMVQEDGTFTHQVGMAHCGKSLLGLGSLLTGAKSFEELTELADRGERSRVDNFPEDITFSEDSVYSDALKAFDNKRPCFLFGKAVGGSLAEFSREDLASSIVGDVANVQATLFQLAARRSHARLVLVCGSLPAHSATFRREMETDFRMSVEMNDPDEVKQDIRFIKLGGFLACFGALVKSLQKA